MELMMKIFDFMRKAKVILASSKTVELFGPTMCS